MNTITSHSMDCSGIKENAKVAERFAAELDGLAATVGNVNGLEKSATKLRKYATDLREDSFKIVVVGGFNRGKSTLLNAVLGCDLLPQHFVPSTAIISVLEYSQQPQATVKFLDETKPDETLTLDQFRSRYVLNEEDHAGGRIQTDRFTQVKYAKVGYPLDLCRHGVKLVDSPGLDDDAVRTKRTVEFLGEAHAIVMLLDATELIGEREVHFLETVLLPQGLKNIFFVINKWNLLTQMVRPREFAGKVADLNERIRYRLHPFCIIDHGDQSAARIFRVNALGALDARLADPVNTIELEASNVPAFERSLEQFLLKEKGRARLAISLANAQAMHADVCRFIDSQVALAGKSIEEIEVEKEALEPKLDRLRGIRQHIENFLDSQSSVLQDRLVLSFGNEINAIQKELPAAIDKFGELEQLTKGSMLIKSMTDWTKSDEKKFSAQVERHLRPRLTHYLEQHLAKWRQSVMKNEVSAVSIDVERHLQKEAEEYCRVMREIENRLGIDRRTLDLNEMVQNWLSGGEMAKRCDFGGIGFGALGDMSWLVGSIALDVMGHLATAWVPLIGAAVTAVRLVIREITIRDEMKAKIITGISEKLSELKVNHSAQIREEIQKNFDQLKAKVTGNIAEEISLVDVSLQGVIERKQSKMYSAQEEQARLEDISQIIEQVLERMCAMVLEAA